MPYYEYPRAALTADVVVLAGPSEARTVLLVLRKHPPFEGMWALPGGFVDEGEFVEDAARRELYEETGLSWKGEVVQVGAYADPGRDPRGWTASVAWVVDVGADPPSVRGGDDAADAAWHALGSLPALAFDHDRIIADAVRLVDRGGAPAVD